LEPNYTYLDINTADVWEFERTSFLDENSTEEHGRKLISAMQVIIFKNAKPQFSISDFTNGKAEDRNYFKRKVEVFQQHCNSTKGLFTVEYFFARDALYQYDHDIIIDATNDNFEYWFALKTRQYVDNLTALGSFLSHQLNKNFGDNFDEFSKFLKPNIRQHKGALYSEKIVDTIGDWIDEQQPTNHKQTALDTDNETTHIAASFNSFSLKAHRLEPNYFSKNINDVVEVLHQLKLNRFIHPETKLDRFKAIFQNKSIDPTERIIWMGSHKELQWFVHILSSDLKKIETLQKDIWLITGNCFVSKTGKDFSVDQLRKAAGTQLDRRKLLHSALAVL
jgi:hypothetical protein